jgi:parvulin-like peptidyl-prolyl isomerase
MMTRRFYLLSLSFALSVSTAFAESGESTGELGQSQNVLARQGDVVLTQAEIDAAFSKIPPEKRLPFIRDGQKVEELVRNLLYNKTMAEEARKASYDQEALVKLRLSLAQEKELASEWLKKVVRDAPPVDYEAIAYERYLVEPEAWKTEPKFDVSHILISSDNRSSEAAGKMAMNLWEELQTDPDRFDSMVEEYSEDPSKKINGGRFPNIQKGQMVEPFEVAAFALKEDGEISLPVETSYGFHIIRLNRKTPGKVLEFVDIKAQAMEQVRKKYLDDYRTRYLQKTLSNRIVLPDGAAEEMAKRYFGENLELAPQFDQ